MVESQNDLERRVATLEESVAQLRPRSPPTTEPSAPSTEPSAAGDDLWALRGLRDRGVEAVLMAGTLTVPTAGPVAWQYGLSADALLDLDWGEFASTIDGLSHPARLTILRLVLSGVHSTADLVEQAALGTTGQLHHHLRQLVAAGWLSLVRRGEYVIPAHRVVPLLIVILAAQR